jgi:hypothetical protein
MNEEIYEKMSLHSPNGTMRMSLDVHAEQVTEKIDSDYKEQYSKQQYETFVTLTGKRKKEKLKESHVN